MTGNEPQKLGAILLAAGGSTRFGRPKQLAELHGETLLRRAARMLAESVFDPVAVVIGEVAQELEVKELAVTCIVNRHRLAGMSTSIRAGLDRLLELEPDLDGVLIALCDQPAITTTAFDIFAARFGESHAPAIASAYDGTVGVPALFSKQLFPDLRALEGDKGARTILRKRADVLTIDLPEAALDIDAPSDLRPIRAITPR